MRVCTRCLINPTVRRFIFKNGEPGSCDVCDSENTTVLDASTLAEIFEPLLQLYHPAESGQDYAWDPEEQKPMFGDYGEPLQDLIQEWGIFGDEIDEAIPEILKELFPDYDESTLYASDDLWYVAPDKEFRGFAEKLMHERRWFPKKDYSGDNVGIDQLLGNHLRHFCVTTSPSQKLKRGRIHVRALGTPIPTGHTLAEMGCPPIEKVLRGMRANPAGIAYLYLASDELTCIAELRALAGDYVSVGESKYPVG